MPEPGPDLAIRAATDADRDAIWTVLEPAIRAGETLALPRDMTRLAALAYWTGPDRRTFVAAAGGSVLGAYYLRPNQAGGGGHVCNCGYATHAAARGRGVARAMCLHSIEAAQAAGFRAMQFNLVVASNEPALRLWRDLGFQAVGRLPEAFDHPRLGLVDALVMHRRL